MQSRNLAARAGGWSAQHRKAAVIGWILFVVIAVVAGHVAEVGFDFKTAFEYGLDLILDALERRRDASPSTRS